MKMLLLENAKIFDGQRNHRSASLSIDEKNITEISFENTEIFGGKKINFKGESLFAGFVDIHNHGAAGVDVNTATADDLRKASKFLATQGVTAWLPTFVPDAIENYQKVIEAIDEVMQTQDAEQS